MTRLLHAIPPVSIALGLQPLLRHIMHATAPDRTHPTCARPTGLSLTCSGPMLPGRLPSLLLRGLPMPTAVHTCADGDLKALERVAAFDFPAFLTSTPPLVVAPLASESELALLVLSADKVSVMARTSALLPLMLLATPFVFPESGQLLLPGTVPRRMVPRAPCDPPINCMGRLAHIPQIPYFPLCTERTLVVH